MLISDIQKFKLVDSTLKKPIGKFFRKTEFFNSKSLEKNIILLKNSLKEKEKFIQNFENTDQNRKIKTQVRSATEQKQTISVPNTTEAFTINNNQEIFPKTKEINGQFEGHINFPKPKTSKKSSSSLVKGSIKPISQVNSPKPIRSLKTIEFKSKSISTQTSVKVKKQALHSKTASMNFYKQNSVLSLLNDEDQNIMRKSFQKKRYESKVEIEGRQVEKVYKKIFDKNTMIALKMNKDSQKKQRRFPNQKKEVKDKIEEKVMDAKVKLFFMKSIFDFAYPKIMLEKVKYIMNFQQEAYEKLNLNFTNKRNSLNFERNGNHTNTPNFINSGKMINSINLSQKYESLDVKKDKQYRQLSRNKMKINVSRPLSQPPKIKIPLIKEIKPIQILSLSNIGSNQL